MSSSSATETTIISPVTLNALIRIAAPAKSPIALKAREGISAIIARNKAPQK